MDHASFRESERAAHEARADDPGLPRRDKRSRKHTANEKFGSALAARALAPVAPSRAPGSIIDAAPPTRCTRVNMTNDPQRLFFPDTASRLGRQLAVSPANSPLEYLNYGRIRLAARGKDGTHAQVSFESGSRETGLLCMKGECRLRAVPGDASANPGPPQDISISLHDGVYVPRGWFVELSTDNEVDLVECSAEVTGSYPFQVVRYADVASTPSLKFTTGGDNSRRDLNVVLGSNVEAGRIVVGFTRSCPGHWTSWPPHEHTAILEEAYVYFDMPAPAFGIQLVYGGTPEEEFAKIVRDGDAVVMPAGYHPNVAAPGHSINFIWMMAARTEVTDRLFGVVNIQPGFAAGGSGLEASRR
jgi:5-deoxy-glucuronate isomerase